MPPVRGVVAERDTAREGTPAGVRERGGAAWARSERTPMISTERHGDVLVVTVDNPPVNALGTAVRRAIGEALASAQSDAAVAALVIRGAGTLFSGGADITEFGKPGGEPGLPDLCDAVEASGKPVIAALHGTCFGGGLELALSCHGRVAAPSAKLGLPEVKIGLLPGAGGTQRLPRLVGVARALDMIVSGDPIDALAARDAGLVDRVVPEAALLDAAIALAREAAGRGPPRRTGALEAEGGTEDVERFVAAKGRVLKGRDAPAACIRAVRGSFALPLAEGLAQERRLFGELLGGAQSKALRHAFFAERAANKIEGLPADARPLGVERVGIVGAGTMGGGIAMNFLTAGLPVTMVERERAALDRGVALIRANYERSAKRGKFTGEEVEAAMGRLTPVLELGALADCDLVIEAAFELMDVKKEIFGRLDRICKAGAILASNTSYLDIDEIAAATSRPGSVLGLHFFSPANVMRLLEVVRGAETEPAVLATAMAVGKRLGKVAVVSGVCHGFVGNRMLNPRQEQADALILEGAAPEDVDRVMLEFGMPMGPFQMADLAGLDLGWTHETSKGETVRDILCQRGRRGQKTAKGFYDYDADRRRTPSAEVKAVIAEVAARQGVARRAIGDDEIRERLLYSMVNEGAKILDEGIAQRASDIDVVWINGYGWPAATGGPMFWAESIGYGTVVAGLAKHRDRLGEAGEPSPRLVAADRI